MADPFRERTEADKIRARYASQAKVIQERPDLNDRGRDQRLSGVLVQARKDMAALRKFEAEQIEARRRHLQQRLFGNPKSGDSAAVISFRDALDRADRLQSPDEAAALLDCAVMSGDDILGRAIAMRAMARVSVKGVGDGWRQVVERWVDGQPSGTIEEVQELIDLEHSSSDIKSRFAQGLAYSLPTPGRLRGRDIERLAVEAENLPG